MERETKIRRTEWAFLGFLVALCGGMFFFTKFAAVMILIVIGLMVLKGKTWPRIRDAFLQYNEKIKMMPHM